MPARASWAGDCGWHSAVAKARGGGGAEPQQRLQATSPCQRTAAMMRPSVWASLPAFERFSWPAPWAAARRIWAAAGRRLRLRHGKRVALALVRPAGRPGRLRAAEPHRCMGLLCSTVLFVEAPCSVAQFLSGRPLHLHLRAIRKRLMFWAAGWQALLSGRPAVPRRPSGPPLHRPRATVHVCKCRP